MIIVRDKLKFANIRHYSSPQNEHCCYILDSFSFAALQNTSIYSVWYMPLFTGVSLNNCSEKSRNNRPKFATLR